MWFNLFRHKKTEEEPRTFDGRFITDEEIYQMVKPKTGTFIKRELDDINEKMNKLRQNFE